MQSTVRWAWSLKLEVHPVHREIAPMFLGRLDEPATKRRASGGGATVLARKTSGSVTTRAARPRREQVEEPLGRDGMSW